MKQLPAALAEHLASGTTTLCWCWRLTRRDGTVQGFTDHDRALVFDGTEYEPESGLSASEASETVGLGVDNLEVTGAISSERLSEADLAAGLYDEARVEIFRVNWQDVTQRARVRVGSLGEVRRAGTAFAAEVRGLAHYLQQPRGRLFQYSCDADLGDARCGIALDAPPRRLTGAVIEAASARKFTASGLADRPTGWFTRGTVTFTSGPANGQRIEVKRHAVSGGVVTIELWQEARGPLAPGQTFAITAGCDKTIATCRQKFANAVNFRGFPHMPGNDFLTVVSRPGRKAR